MVVFGFLFWFFIIRIIFWLLVSFCVHWLVLERLSPQPRRIELTTPLEVSVGVSRDVGARASPSVTLFVKPTVAPLSLLSSRYIESVGTQSMKTTGANRALAPFLPAQSDLQPSTTDSFSATSQVREAASEIAPHVTDAVPPLPIGAVIEFSRHGFIGQTIISTHLWRSVGDHYSLSVEGGSTGGLMWFEATSSPIKSEGQLLDDELRPESFLGTERRSIRFDWAGGEARSDDSKAFALQSDTQDPLSLAYQVMRLIRRGVTSVVVLDGQEARAYDLTLLAEETVELPAGQFPAWRVRIALQSNPQVFTELWLGKETYGMPIRIRESLGDGSFRELVAERISVDAP